MERNLDLLIQQSYIWKMAWRQLEGRKSLSHEGSDEEMDSNEEKHR
jgi:hypothetical protein